MRGRVGGCQHRVLSLWTPATTSRARGYGRLGPRKGEGSWRTLSPSPQFSILVSSGACGGVLIAIALRSGRRLGAAMRGALRDDDEVAWLDLDFLVAEPDRAGAFENVLDLVGVGMHVLADIAVLDRNRRAFGIDEHLGVHAAGIGRAERVAGEIAGVDDLRHDGICRDRRPQQMGDAAAGGKGGSDR